MNDTTRIRPETLAHLQSAARQAVTHTAGGMDPSEAVAKVASAYDLNDEFTKRVVELYNISRTLNHFNTNAAGEKRAADFPLAVYEKVREHRLAPPAPEAVKAASELRSGLDFMSIQPGQEKAAAEEKKASPYARDLQSLVNKALAAEDRYKKAASEAKLRKTALELQQDTLFRKIATYFRIPGHIPFEEVESRLQAGYGQQLGSQLADAAWDCLGSVAVREKRASAPAVAYFSNKEPYTLFDQAFELTYKLAAACTEHEQACAEHDAYRKDLEAALAAVRSLEKAGTFFEDVLSGKVISDTATNIAPGAAGDNNVAKALESLSAASDPVHDARIAAVKAESNLQRLMNTDPVVKNYNPNDVLDVYNELAQLAPKAVEQPILLRGYMRQMLESSPSTQGRNLDPYSAKQLADVGQTLKAPEQARDLAVGKMIHN